MIKKAVTTLVISVMLIVASFMLYDINSKIELEHEIEQYLQANGYNEKEIQKIRVFRSNAGFEAGVIFRTSKTIEHFFIRDQKSKEIRKKGERFIQK